LEEGLAGPLLDRRSRPVQLTPLGALFLPYAERALAILNEAQLLAQTRPVDSPAQLRIACPFSVATYLMPDVLVRFGEAFPQAELLIDTGTSEVVVSQLADGLIDLAIAAAFPKFLAQMQTLLRLHDEMIVAVAPGHPLAAGQPASLGAVWPYRQLLIHWGPAFDAYVESLRQMSHNPGPLVRLPLAGALPMARRPDTVTFMPRRLAAASGLIEVNVAEFAFDWDIALLARPGRTLAPLEDEFVAMVNKVWHLGDRG
jgi:DNA-binding transcriptional LysR family regulator